MEKQRYETDPNNRLIIKSTGKEGELTGFRQILDGAFAIGSDNTLTYHAKMPVDGHASTERQIKLKGKWSLDPEHNLTLTIDSRQSRTAQDTITITGEIIDKAAANSLSFAVTTHDSKGNFFGYVLELQGVWQADERNRLTFCVHSKNAFPDVLTFEGAWEIDDNYQIRYRYQKEDRISGTKKTAFIQFEGRWDILDKTRVAYLVSGSSDSCFEFKGSVGVFSGTSIRYEIGIDLQGQKTGRTITFFGSWKITSSVGLSFEIKEGKGGINSFTFGAQTRLSDRDMLRISLKNSRAGDLGVELELSRDIVQGNSSAFIRLVGSKGDQGIFIGAGFRW